MPVLRQLHWRQRNEFKLATQIYKALNGLSPHSLTYDCLLTATTGRRHLRSSNITVCEIPRTH